MQFPKAKRFTDRRALPSAPLCGSSLNILSRLTHSSSPCSARRDPPARRIRRPDSLASATLQARRHARTRVPLCRRARPKHARPVSPLSSCSCPVRCLTRSRDSNRHVWPVRRGPTRRRQGERSEGEGPHRQLHHHHCRRRPRTPQAAGAPPHWSSLQAPKLTLAPHPPPPARRPPHPPLRRTRQGARKAARKARQARRGEAGTPQGEGGAVQGGGQAQEREPCVVARDRSVGVVLRAHLRNSLCPVPPPRLPSHAHTPPTGHLTSKLTLAAALQQKYESTLPSLQAKLSSLTTQHAASSAKKDAELSALRGALSRAEADTDEARAEARAWEGRARRERRGREDAALAAGELVASLRAERSALAPVEDLAAERLARVALERRVADREAVLASVGEHARALEERLALAGVELDEASWREWRVREMWRTERDMVVSPGRDEKEWRQRARADGREMEGLREEVGMWEKEAEREREWDELRGEWERRRDKAWREERKRMERDYEVVEGECVTLSDSLLRPEVLTADTGYSPADSTLPSTTRSRASKPSSPRPRRPSPPRAKTSPPPPRTSRSSNPTSRSSRRSALTTPSGSRASWRSSGGWLGRPGRRLSGRGPRSGGLSGSWRRRGRAKRRSRRRSRGARARRVLRARLHRLGP